jgi:hypothetical protein
MMLVESPEWIEDCKRWRGRVLTGFYCHWCDDWDGLPIDETTPEWPCVCYREIGEPS